MHPYREPAPPELPSRDAEWGRDDRILAILMLAAGGLRVAIAMIRGEDFGTEVTIAALFTALGALLLGWSVARR